MKPKANKTTSFRLTEEAKRIISELSSALGVTQTAIVELSIRKMAKSEKKVKNG